MQSKKLKKTAIRMPKSFPQLKYIINEFENISLGYTYTVVPINNGEGFTTKEIITLSMINIPNLQHIYKFSFSSKSFP